MSVQYLIINVFPITAHNRSTVKSNNKIVYVDGDRFSAVHTLDCE